MKIHDYDLAHLACDDEKETIIFTIITTAVVTIGILTLIMFLILK